MSAPANMLGGYQLTREIARSNDIVYEARDPQMNRRVALKELALTPNLIGEERRHRIERFYREARAAGNLHHPNIVTIYKVGEDQGRHFIAMEFLEGDTLRSMLQVGGALSLQKSLEICAQICDALDYAHQHGVVHRDIKPDNIQILPNGTAKLTDFGIARVGAEPSLTQAGQVFGTPSYMSPEQITGKAIDHRTDIYSMGVVLYEVLTNRKPFTGDSVVTITYNIMNLDVPSPPGVPLHLQQIVRKAMAREPENRYQTAGELARALRAPAPPQMPFLSSQQTTGSFGTVLPAFGAGSFAGSGQQAPPWMPAPHPPIQPTQAVGPLPVGGPSGGGGSFSFAPGAPALPPPHEPFGSGFRDFFIRQSAFLSLLIVGVILVLIALLVALALTSGYQAQEARPTAASGRSPGFEAPTSGAGTAGFVSPPAPGGFGGAVPVNGYSSGSFGSGGQRVPPGSSSVQSSYPSTLPTRDAGADRLKVASAVLHFQRGVQAERNGQTSVAQREYVQAIQGGADVPLASTQPWYGQARDGLNRVTAKSLQVSSSTDGQ